MEERDTERSEDTHIKHSIMGNVVKKLHLIHFLSDTLRLLVKLHCDGY